MEAINEIIERELERLNELSKESALNLNQLKGLEILVKTLKTQLGDDSPVDDLNSLSMAELLAIAKGNLDAPPTQEAKNDKRRGRKTSRSDARK